MMIFEICCIKILITSALLWVITNFAFLARPTQLRSREQTMKYSVRVGSAAPSRAPTCPGPSCRGRSPPSWPRARRPSRRRTRTNKQQRTNQILYSMLKTKNQCILILGFLFSRYAIVRGEIFSAFSVALE